MRLTRPAYELAVMYDPDELTAVNLLLRRRWTWTVERVVRDVAGNSVARAYVASGRARTADAAEEAAARFVERHRLQMRRRHLRVIDEDTGQILPLFQATPNPRVTSTRKDHS